MFIQMSRYLKDSINTLNTVLFLDEEDTESHNALRYILNMLTEFNAVVETHDKHKILDKFESYDYDLRMNIEDMLILHGNREGDTDFVVFVDKFFGRRG